MSIFSKIIAFFMSIIAFFAGLFSGGKKPVDPTPSPSNPTSYTFYDYSYGSDSRQKLDLVLPENASGEKGLILCIHGGGWFSGDKNEFRSNLSSIVNAGYAAAAINYRYISASVHMDQLMADVSAALGKIKALAAESGVTLNKVLLTGYSAGAHMSLLYAYKYASAAPIAPVAVVSNCGPTDLTAPAFIEQNQLGSTYEMIGLMNQLSGVTITEADYRDKTAQYDAWIAALRSYSPLYQVKSTSAPTVLGHGRQDTIVPFDNALALDSALNDSGVRHDFVVFSNSGHDLDKDPDSSQRMYELLVIYAQAYLG